MDNSTAPAHRVAANNAAVPRDPQRPWIEPAVEDAATRVAPCTPNVRENAGGGDRKHVEGRRPVVDDPRAKDGSSPPVKRHSKLPQRPSGARRFDGGEHTRTLQARRYRQRPHHLVFDVGWHRSRPLDHKRICVVVSDDGTPEARALRKGVLDR